MESVGFKEWALVCEALGRGEQSIIVRKGGIAEGRDGFSFRYREFFLFPTFFHEQVEKVRGAAPQVPARRAGEIEIKFFARLERSFAVTDRVTAAALEPFHILHNEVVRERFDYDEAPGVHVAFVRAYRLAEPWTFPDAQRYGGCRSWVNLPPIPDGLSLEPVISEAQHAKLAAELQNAVRPPYKASASA
jgi:hypothetical protein